MFRLCQLRPEGSDCTAPYNVELGGDYIVEEFIRDVLLDTGEWGYIGIRHNNTIFGDPHCEYSHGELKSTLPETYLKMKIVSATASGGWSRMDYLLRVDVVNDVFYQVTEHYGIRAEDIYGDTHYALYRVNEVNSEYRVAAFRNKAAAVNECKYLERLNAPRWDKEKGE